MSRTLSEIILVGSVVFLATACAPQDLSNLGGDTPTEAPSSPTPGTDQDADGFSLAEDCDDTRADVNPDATEICDGIDNDCDGSTDIGDSLVHYADSDLDGFGTGEAIPGCTSDSAFSGVAGDCDDANPQVKPGVPEACDGLDTDCDALTDENTDGDGDGFSACQRDCDDTNETTHPARIDDDGLEAPPDTAYFSDVQSAIDSPDSCNTLYIYPGTYTQALLVQGVDDYVITGVEGKDQTFLESDTGASILTIDSASRVEVSGITFQAPYPIDGFGGGIRLTDSEDVTLEDLSFLALSLTGSGSFGAGVGVSGCTNVLVQNCYFEGNEANQAGGLGVDSSDVLLRGSTFRDNYGTLYCGAVGSGDVYEGGVGPGTLAVEESYFFDNSAYYWGGAASAENGSVLTIARSYFDGNQTLADSPAQVGSGGGAIYNAVSVTETYFFNNVAFTYAGALMVSDPSLVERNFFWHNRGYLSAGALNIYSSLSSIKPKKHLIQYNTFVDNVAPLGASIYYYDGDLAIIQGNVFHNANTENTNLCNAEIVGDLELEYNLFHNSVSKPSDLGCVENSELDFNRSSNVFADPLFVTYSNDTKADFFSQDFHLQEGSPAKGTAQLGPNGESYDMGAYGGPNPIEWVPDPDAAPTPTAP